MMRETETALDTAQVKRQVLDAFRFRHACKAFDPDKRIADDDFAYILETGRLSPSSYGWEPWSFVVLQDMAVRERLRPHTWGAQRTLPTASHYVLLLSRTADTMAPDSPYIQHMMKDIQQLPDDVVSGKGNVYRTFLESDFRLLEHKRLVFEWASRQTYIALGNMMTAAAMIGIDSCPIEGFQQEPIERILREEGILTEGFGLSCMVAFGYRANDPARPKTRRPIEEVVTWR